ncbi:AraC family transcriptional regulator [Paenibacillus sp. WLX2291]|uniref:helix-turn-helix transcriptional regulator n=1 Tax=Paenibacillus sp. WLX2291 TaxID=3296934 RepID=UPI003984508D
MQPSVSPTAIFEELSEFVAVHMKSCREMVHPAPWFEHKTHHDYDLWMIRKGSLQLQIGDQQYAVSAGDVLFFYPDLPYMASAQNEDCEFIFIHFDFGMGEQQRILDDLPLSGIIPQPLLKREWELFCDGFDRRESGAAGSRLYLKACLTALIARIIELYGTAEYAQHVTPFMNGALVKRQWTALEPVLRYIQEHLHRPLKIRELAQQTGLSEKYFIAVFKKTLGITPGQYIFQIKMNRAREYLYTRHYNVQQIAGLLGYCDAFAFSKAFKQYYGVAPSQFV